MESWATAYGASFTGQYGGQRGDGRAISIGQVGDLEVQLKGAGVTPFSRRFDGRAVLRSTVREFLASEAMHALRVPTTRALCVVTTGGERVRRAWYDDKGREKLSMELGAVGTRVASSFLRFGQMELFYQNDEYELLRELAEHALMRDFGYLKVQSPEGPFSEHLIAMFEEICERQAKLVAEWIRVGCARAPHTPTPRDRRTAFFSLARALYTCTCVMAASGPGPLAHTHTDCQGNMNSDNSALNGVTLDYGPFAFMEKFNPTYNPWVGGGQPYCFGMQPQAAAINLSGLSAPFVELVERAAKDEGLSASDIRERIERVRACVSHTYVDTFDKTHDANCRDKLGLSTWDDEAQQLWDDLFRLMSVAGQYGGVDFTLLFRGLTDMLPPSTADGAAGNGGVVDAAGAADAAAGDDDDALLGALRAAALSPIDDWTEEHRGEWVEWHQRYWRRIAAEGRSAAERREVMARTNPKYIPRNWMMLEAYEAAERGDYELIAEIHHVLRSPYEEQSADVAQKWAQLTPHWARDRAGVAFMS